MMPLWRLLPMTLIVLLVACSRPPLVDAVDRGDEGAVAALRVPRRRLLAWLGPAIGPAAFEVGSEVREQFVSADVAAADAFRRSRDDRCYADLYALARLRLAACGVVAVSGGEWCTYRESERFFSYRRDGQTGRMATLIWRDA